MNTATPTRYDRRMQALMNDPKTHVLHATKGRRRAAVAAHIALTGAFVACLTVLYAADQLWAAFALLALLVPYVVTTGILNAATRGLVELRSRVLDERQLAERERARAVAHRMTGALILGAAVGLWLAAWCTDGQLTRAYAAPLLGGVFVLHWLMPLWVAALQVKDVPVEDLEADLY
ncbi:hypothetical protein ACIO3O_05635 [Streptomyces sp. NPDC087440]|uniref:hypothetical protein n=1 Tax=Streptomyces sp. NPDC087440 TaxID=3365790 RepID=UPI00382A08DF